MAVYLSQIKAQCFGILEAELRCFSFQFRKLCDSSGQTVSIQNLQLSLGLVHVNGFEVILNEEKGSSTSIANPCSALCCAKSSAITVSKKSSLEWSCQTQRNLFRNTNSVIALKRESHWVQVVFDFLASISLLTKVQLRCIHCYVIWTTKQQPCEDAARWSNWWQTFDAKAPLYSRSAWTAASSKQYPVTCSEKMCFPRTRKQVLC